MPPRIGTSSGCFLGLLLIACGSAGCSTNRGEVTPPPHVTVSPGAQLFSQAKFFDARGESVRAEQYFLAAVREGIPRSEVFPLLLQSCIESGRLRSALNHVEEELRYGAGEPGLLQLGASLSWALDQPKVAFRFVDRLEQVKAKRLQTRLFLAEFYEQRTGDIERSLFHYQEALNIAQSAVDLAWIRANVVRLEQQAGERTIVLAEREVGHD